MSAGTETAIVKIDPRAVSPADYQTACRVLSSSIRLALADPKQRAEFEEWKKQQEQKRSEINEN